MVSVALNSLYGKCIGTCKQGKIFSRALGGMKEITTVGNDGKILKRVTQTVNSEGQHTTIVQDFVGKLTTRIDRKLEENGDKFFSNYTEYGDGTNTLLTLLNNKIPNFFRRHAGKRDKRLYTIATDATGVERAHFLSQVGKNDVTLDNSYIRTVKNGNSVDEPLAVSPKLMSWLKNIIEKF